MTYTRQTAFAKRNAYSRKRPSGTDMDFEFYVVIRAHDLGELAVDDAASGAVTLSLLEGRGSLAGSPLTMAGGVAEGAVIYTVDNADPTDPYTVIADGFYAGGISQMIAPPEKSLRDNVDGSRTKSILARSYFDYRPQGIDKIRIRTVDAARHILPGSIGEGFSISHRESSDLASDEWIDTALIDAANFPYSERIVIEADLAGTKVTLPPIHVFNRFTGDE